MKEMRTNTIVASTVAMLGLAAAAHAQTWTETGDAGNMPGSSQMISGSVTTITGTLTSGTDIDMYGFNIVNAANFSALVTIFSGGSTDSQLYLFNAGGMGIAFDDDGGAGLFSEISNSGAGEPGADANLITNSGNGLHYLAITDYDTDALNLSGGTQAANGIWHDFGPYDGPFAPDGPGSSNAVLAGWSFGDATTPITYTIQLQGVPGPGALALLGLAGLVSVRRRRA